MFDLSGAVFGIGFTVLCVILFGRSGIPAGLSVSAGVFAWITALLVMVCAECVLIVYGCALAGTFAGLACFLTEYCAARFSVSLLARLWQYRR